MAAWGPVSSRSPRTTWVSRMFVNKPATCMSNRFQNKQANGCHNKQNFPARGCARAGKIGTVTSFVYRDFFLLTIQQYLRLDVNTIAANTSKIDGMLAVDELAFG
uniref:(northern house mosquito) hypothetical protein n=1 Tax=Culex pipiens TaxID=7175 RepID=A0A8D8F1Z7_CULPI